MIDVSGIDLRNTVVRCATIDEARIFIQYLCDNGVRDRRNAERLLREWQKYESDTCYHISQSRWCSGEWYKENCPGICIVDFCDIYTEEQALDLADIKLSYESLFQ